MPLARFHLYAQGVEIWVAPTLARGDGWIATMRHIAREGRVWVIGVNPSCTSTRSPPTSPAATGSGGFSTTMRPSGSSLATA